MNLLKEERETNIVFTEADTMATVYTRSRSITSRMEKLCKRNVLATVEKKQTMTGCIKYLSNAYCPEIY